MDLKTYYDNIYQIDYKLNTTFTKNPSFLFFFVEYDKLIVKFTRKC